MAGVPQHRLQMVEIVVPEDLLVGAARSDARDHRGVVSLVGQDQAIRQQPADRTKRRLIGHVAGREDKRGVLSMQVGEFCLKRDDGMAIAGDVSRAASAGARPLRRLDHGIDDEGVAAHPEIVVGAPYDDVAAVAAIAPPGIRRTRGVPLEIGENPIAALPANPVEVRLKMVA